MEKFEAASANASDSTTLPPKKRDSSISLEQAKLFALDSKQRLLELNATSSRFVVSLNSAKHSQSRMLTLREIEDLRKTKRMVSERMVELLKQA
jgi:hypothetical protein